jgi:lambda family phage portal protein
MQILNWFKKTPQLEKTQKRYFNAARVDRFTASWLAGSNHINDELKNDLNKLRERSRDLSKNNEYGKKFKTMVVSNVVGPSGFTLQVRSGDYVNNKFEPSRIDNDAIENEFIRWAKRGVCEITGKMSFTGLCRLLAGSMPSDGEFLVRIIRGKDAANDYGFALQVLDVDRIDTKFNRASGNGINAIVMGVEIDKYSRPVAYYILSAHSTIQGQRERERIPAEDMIHGFMVEFAEQIRGIPWMSSSILTLHHLSKFEESAMLAARKGADTIGFFVTPDGTPPVVGGGDESQEPIEVSVPGSYDTLPDGVDYRPNETKYPDAMLEAFTKGFLRRVASGFNVTYNGLANDLENVNFSSIRAGVIEERDQWMTLQKWFDEVFLRVVYEEWLKVSLLKGIIKLPSGFSLPASRLEKFKAHHWQGRRWQWVDPAKDIAAARDSIKSAVLSPQMVAAQQGVDIEDVIEDIKRFEELTTGINTIDYGDGKASQPVVTDVPK